MVKPWCWCHRASTSSNRRSFNKGLAMLSVKEVESPHLAVSGLDGDLTEEERALQDKIRRFALAVMRPAAAQLDTMTAQEAIDPGSPLWTCLDRFEELGTTP